jgi:hypothetical protein
MSLFHNQFSAVLFTGSVLFATSLIAAEIPAANPQANGFSQSRLDHIAPIMKIAMDEGKVVGGHATLEEFVKVLCTLPLQY